MRGAFIATAVVVALLVVVAAINWRTWFPRPVSASDVVLTRGGGPLWPHGSHELNHDTGWFQLPDGKGGLGPPRYVVRGKEVTSAEYHAYVRAQSNVVR